MSDAPNRTMLIDRLRERVLASKDAEIERLRAALATCRELRDFDAAEMRRLRAALSAIVHPDNAALVYFVPGDSHAQKLLADARASLATGERRDG